MPGSTSKLKKRQLIGCVLAFIWQLIGCGTIDPRQGASIEEPFLLHVKTFEEECKCTVRDLPITFGAMDHPTHVGECQNYVVLFESYSEVLIDKEFWDTASDNRKEQLIMHELGHCLLHRAHLTARVHGFPISFMYPYIDSMPEASYIGLRSKYFEELFQRGAYEPLKSGKSRSPEDILDN